MASLPLFLLASLTLLLASACAQAPPAIYNSSRNYPYYGCYETTEIPGSDHARALADGINAVRAGDMTVPWCLAFFANGKTAYRYTGLEWSRECWCSQTLAGISEKLEETQCNIPCQGDDKTACGGSLKLSVYRVSSSSAARGASALIVMLALVVALSSQ